MEALHPTCLDEYPYKTMPRKKKRIDATRNTRGETLMQKKTHHGT
jgi:hypothetical protein